MKTLRNLILLLVAGMIISSCGASYNEGKARRAAEKEAERAALAQALENADVLFEITRIIPRGYPSRISSGEYALRLKKDVVTTRLPFIGDSHEAAYGGADEISIVFKDEKVSLIKDFADASKGEYRYQFRGGEGKDRWTVTIQAYDNGTANIACQSLGGRYMSYFANVTIPRKDAE